MAATNGSMSAHLHLPHATELEAIARAVGTPVHVMNGTALAARYAAFAQAFAGVPHRIHYAIKAHATIAVVRLLRTLGARADANSIGEIEVARRAGFTPGDIVFTGVGKTRAELTRAIGLGVAAINAESAGEIARIAEIAERLGARARVAVRINPDVEAGSHPHISTGRHATKFGVPPADARTLLREAARQPSLQVVGVHVHIGSQITGLDPIVRAGEIAASIAREAAADGLPLEHLDVGGGLGIPYRPDQAVASVDEYASALRQVAAAAGLPLVLEPGRWLVGPAGLLLTEVIDLKPRPGGGTFVVVDAGMTELMRPALYGAYHRIEPVSPRPGPPLRAEVVGPVCETADTLGADRELPPLEVGDLLAVRDTGAYGAVMASNYNRRPIAAEVLVDAEGWRVTRRRQTIDDMLQWDE